MKPKSLQTSVSERGPSVESFFGQPSNQLQPHLWSLGLPSVLAKTSQKAFSACKIVGGRSAAGQSPVNNCIYSNKPGSKNNFPRCVQSPYTLEGLCVEAIFFSLFQPQFRAHEPGRKIADAASGHCHNSHTWPFGQEEVQLREFVSTLHVKPLSGPGNLAADEPHERSESCTTPSPTARLLWHLHLRAGSMKQKSLQTSVSERGPSVEVAGNIDTKNCSSPIACQKTQNRLPKSGSGVSGFRGSNLTKTMASLQDLESFEPLNPLTPDPDFGNLFCVFRQAIGKFLFAIPFFRASYWEIQHRAGPQICSLLASYREIAHNAENCSYSLVYCCKYNCLLGIALPQKTFLQRFYKPKKPFEKFLRAPMEDQRTKDGAVTGSKADQKKDWDPPGPTEPGSHQVRIGTRVQGWWV